METGSTYKTRSTSSHQTSDWGAPREPEEALVDSYHKPSPDIYLPEPSVVAERRKINVGRGERILSLLAGGALLLLGRGRSRVARLGLLAASGGLIYRGVSGYCPVSAAVGRDSNLPATGIEPIVIETQLLINKPRDEVYAYWRQLENLPLLFDHIKQVRPLDELHSHWIIRMPGNMGSLSWDASITEDRPGEKLAWQSVPEALVNNGGEILFRQGPTPEQTDLYLCIHYRPPAGGAGTTIARVLNPLFARLVEEDIQGFKRKLEERRLTVPGG